MQIHIVVKVWKEFDQQLRENVVPFLSKAKATCRAGELNSKLSEREEFMDCVNYFVETLDIAA